MTNSKDCATPRSARTLGAGLRRALTVGALALAVPATASAETLADALAGAYNTSGLLEQNRALLRAADEDVASTIAQLRPILRWSTDITRSYSNRSGNTLASIGGSSGATNLNAGLTAEWLLYDFGRTRLSADAAKEIVLSTRHGLVSVEQQVLLRAVRAYMNVQRNKRFVSLRRNNVRVIGESLRAARDRFDVGEVTRTDVAQAEARLQLSRSNLAQAEGDLVVVDFGATVSGYASDCTRTVALGTAPDRLVEAYEVVRRAQIAGVEAVRAGVPCAELDAVSRGIITDAGFGDHFGHSLGHGVGLDVHEAPAVSTRSTSTLSDGDVITIEPGIYLPGLGGIRIEDTVAVTGGGGRSLTTTSKDLRVL